MTPRALLALAILAASAGAARAQQAPQCPRDAKNPLQRVLLLFSTEAAPVALCFYGDGTQMPVPLRQGCDVTPTDTFMDAPPKGGMHECRESKAGRCRFTCRQM
jgi:hypothetical protein